MARARPVASGAQGCRASAFVSHPHQAEDWIQACAQQLKKPIPPGDLRDKLKPLLKHQAFEAEVQAHEEVMTSVAKVTTGPSAPCLPQSVAQG